MVKHTIVGRYISVAFFTISTPKPIVKNYKVPAVYDDVIIFLNGQIILFYKTFGVVNFIMNGNITKGKMHATTKKTTKDSFAQLLKEFEALESQPQDDMDMTQFNFLRKIPVKKSVIRLSNHHSG
ncbi:MAG: hypothetical protein ACTSRK_12370 [Promethearchaeota archaeon]